MFAWTLLGAIAAVELLSARGAVVEHWWNITHLQGSPDGLQTRRLIGVNGTWPPPPIVSHQGDIVRVHATNGLAGGVGTALHTHGQFFNGSSWFDGAVQTTQCPIPPGQTLTYEIDTSLQTGTYWIHGHHAGQYTDGLRAPFIILPRNGTGRGDNVTWDEEYTLTVSDWYHEEYQYLIDNEFLTWTNPTGAEPVPKSALIYVAKNDSYLHPISDLVSGTGVNDQATIPFEAGKSYKLRVINMSALAMFHVHLDGHELYVIETDGVEVEPYLVETLTISIGQRYSLLVQAKNNTDANYALMVSQSEDMYDVVPDDLILNNTVQIVYNPSVPNAEPVMYDAAAVLNDTEFRPLVQRDMIEHDIEFTLNAFFDTYDDGTNRASCTSMFLLESVVDKNADYAVNNVTYQMPHTPTIFTALSMGNDAMDSKVYGAQTNAFAYPHMARVQLTVFNWDAGFHPFHLHLHEFQLVHKSFDVTSNDSLINPPLSEGQSNPSRRDTVTIPPGGSVTLRWVADNPGAALFHCHVDWHMSSGLAAVFIEAPEKMQERNTSVPQVFRDHCEYWNMATSGNVVGKMSSTDLAGQPWGPFPLVMGWTPKAIGALAGCIITALLGSATIVYYAKDAANEKDLEDELKASERRAAARAPLWSRAARTAFKIKP